MSIADTPTPLLDIGSLSDATLCRPPAPEGDVWERELAVATAAAIDAAAGRLSGAVPILFGALAAGWADAPFAAPGAGGLLAGCDPIGLFDDLLTINHVPPDRLLTVGPDGSTAAGELVEDDLQYQMLRPTAASIVSLVHSGGGVLIRSVEEEDRALTRLHEDLDRVCGQTTRADLALVGDGAVLSEGPDDGARIVISIDGPLLLTTSSRQLHGGDLPPMPTVEPVANGRGVVVPPGRGWRLTGDGSPATAMILVLPRPTLVHVARLPELEMRFWPSLRADAPVDLAGPVESYAGSLLDDGELRRTARTVLGTDAVQRSLARERARMGARWTASLDASMALVRRGLRTDDAVRSPLPGGFQVGIVPDGTPTALCANRRCVRLDSDQARAIAALATGRPVGVAELTAFAPIGTDGPSWATALAVELIQGALAEVVDR